MTISIAVAGAGGRMGRALIRAAAERTDFRVVGGSERPGAAVLGVDIGALAGLPSIDVVAIDDVRTAAAKADVWIDFTTPAATIAALDTLKQTPVRAAIIGTTGLAPDDDSKITDAAKRIAIVRSGNFSLGVNVMAALLEQAAARLGPDWDVEILESHHRRKVDAPSGTALMLGQAVAKGRGDSLNKLRLEPHDGIGAARVKGGIGFASIRGGGIVGEHDVMFASEREALTFSHQALDRSLFADGALAAALWAADKPPGLYSMRDVLGF